MMKVGVHVSIAGSIANAVGRAGNAGCDTFQIFSRNPRGWGYKPLTQGETSAFNDALAASRIFPVVDHMPYLPNLASPREDVYEKSVASLISEISRCGALGIPFLVTHLGHHLGDGAARGRERVIAGINRAFDAADDNVILLLENTAGEKNSVGSVAEEIREVAEGVRDASRVAFCLDTCHAFAAGYEFRTEEGIEETFSKFDREIGLDRIMLIHLNDAKGACGSGLDRHEHIGMGAIGEEGLSLVLQHPLLRSLPFICETPVDSRRDDAGNISKVRELAFRGR
ncbi:MAG: deoxyribonuclease IV [Methanomicrobiales archaeon]|nr:deoxyribonuclease IV [Methanomicrobiales archaeon]